MACFNPSDGDEVAILASPHFAGGATAFWKYRISTGALSVLMEEDASGTLGAMDWGNNGWILVDIGSDIYKIKADGDSLTQLTFTQQNTGPKWSPSSTAYGYTYSGGGPWVSVRTSLTTGLSDTLHQVPIFQNSSWYEENQVVWANSTGVLRGDIDTDTWVIVGPAPVSGDPDNAHYFGITTTDNVAVWSHLSGLYKTDLPHDAGTQLLLPTCDSRYFSSLDYSPQTNKLLAIRRLLTPQDSVTLLAETQLVLMDPNGTGLQVLDIPFPE